MRIMGRESVVYHQDTVLDRADDHPGRSLDYYGTRGETPLEWGGSGAGRLGLDGTVSRFTYAAIFGEGGATDPVTGDRMVATQRPGMELVVSPHKSIAVLGAIGRADDMHAIVDAETTATLDFLDDWFRERGGRRGRSQVRTSTSGLTWAITRHGTSRAGDPAVHDHVLVANIVEMGDTKGGWKALDTAALRDVLHAATIVGRAAASRRAVELGYGIEADDGRSGSLRGWRIAGIPDEVCDLFSKRSAEIDDFVDERGHTSHRARGIAARTTRMAKGEESPEELMPRWHAELEAIGWPPERVRTNTARHAHQRPGMDRQVPTHTSASSRSRSASHHADLSSRDSSPLSHTAPVSDDPGLDAIAAEVLGPESPIGGRKVFSRRDLLVEVGPTLYGQPVERLHEVVDQLLASDAVVPLVAVTAAREQVYAPTEALAVEAAVAETIERLTAQPTRAVDDDLVAAAIAAKEADLGGRLTVGQAGAVRAPRRGVGSGAVRRRGRRGRQDHRPRRRSRRPPVRRVAGARHLHVRPSRPHPCRPRPASSPPRSRPCCGDWTTNAPGSTPAPSSCSTKPR